MGKPGLNDQRVLLLVEDNEDDVFLMRRAFKAAGISNPVHVVSDGQQAVDYLSGVGEFEDRERFPFPSLVFLDLKLPYVSGLEVLRWKKERSLPASIVIVLTSSNEPTDLETAYRLGASSYVVKPPTGEELTAIAKSFRSYWLDHNSFVDRAAA